MRYLVKEEIRARIYFIRHAESNNNVIQNSGAVNYEDVRTPDPKLSERGELQAEACAKYLKKKGVNPKMVYSSCYTRALETAKYIQSEFNCEAQVIKLNNFFRISFSRITYFRVDIVLTCVEIKILTRELYEVGGLQYKGKGFRGEGKKYFQQHYPSFKPDESVLEDGWYFHEKKETNEQAQERVTKVIMKVLDLCHKSEGLNKQGIIPDFVFVSHGNFLDFLVGALLFRQPGAVSYILHNNTGITAFDVTVNNNFLIKYLNESNHLEDLHIETNQMTESTSLMESLTLKTHQSQPVFKSVNSNHH